MIDGIALTFVLIFIFLGGGILGVKAEQHACKHKWKQLGEITKIFSVATERQTGKITRYCCDICGKIETFRDEL